MSPAHLVLPQETALHALQLKKFQAGMRHRQDLSVAEERYARLQMLILIDHYDTKSLPGLLMCLYAMHTFFCPQGFHLLWVLLQIAVGVLVFQHCSVNAVIFWQRRFFLLVLYCCWIAYSFLIAAMLLSHKEKVTTVNCL